MPDRIDHEPLESQIAMAQIVHVIEDDLDLREALEALLESSDLSCRSHQSAVQFLESPPLEGGGCLVVDVRMPGLSGIDLIKEVRRRKIPLPIIMMTAHADVPVTIQAFKLGAVEFLLKPFSNQQFMEAVQSALQSDRERLREAAAAESVSSRLEQLNQKDWEVIQLIRQGWPNKRIATELGISERAIEMRRASLMKKAQVSTLSALIELVTRFELLNGS